jgi:hypothetical protein
MHAATSDSGAGTLLGSATLAGGGPTVRTDIYKGKNSLHMYRIFCADTGDDYNEDEALYFK